MEVYVYIIVGMSASFVLCIGSLFFYFGYRKNLAHQQYKMKEAEIQHQKHILNATITSQENERKRIGMELHDEVGAELSSLRLLISHIVPVADMQHLPAIKLRIDHIIDNVRNIAHDLSPRIKGEYGFYDALCGFCDLVSLSGIIGISLVFTEERTKTGLRENKALAVYRVIGELINNTIKHARADTIKIIFSIDKDVYRIDYHDNGTGIREAQIMPGIGLYNIESRLTAIGSEYKIHRDQPGFRTIISIPQWTT